MDRYFVNRKNDASRHQNLDMTEAPTFGQRVKAVRKERKLTQKQLCAKIGMSQGNLSDIENGHVPSSTYTTAIAEVLGVNALWLAEGRGPKQPQQNVVIDEGHYYQLEPTLPHGAYGYARPSEVPVVGTTQGGPPDRIWEELSYPTGYSDEYLQVSTPDPHAYALRVVGSSMAPRIMEGEWLLVEPTGEAQPGDDVVVKTVDGRVMVKVLLSQHSGTIILSSVNEAFERITLHTSEIVFIHFVAGRFASRSVKRRIVGEPPADHRRIIQQGHEGKDRRMGSRGIHVDPDFNDPGQSEGLAKKGPRLW